MSIHPASHGDRSLYSAHSCQLMTEGMWEASTETNVAVTLARLDPVDPTGTMGIQEFPLPQPCAGEVLVRVLLRPVNPSDSFSLTGLFPNFQAPNDGAPIVPGREGMGIVAELGSGVTRFAIGERVVGTPFPQGTWQRYLIAPESDVMKVAAAVSDEAASQFYVNPVSAVTMLHEVAVPAGEWLLQTAASSTLGRMVISIAKHKGFKTINIVRKREMVQELKALGADEVLVSGEDDIAEKVKAITGGQGAWGALDCVGGDVFAGIVASIRNGGTAQLYGAVGGLSASFATPDALFRGVAIKGYWITAWMASKTAEERHHIFQEVMDLMAEGVIDPCCWEKYPLEKAKEAVMASMQGLRGGEVLLEG